MKIAIIGIGALGCLLGAKLSPHADVTLIGRWQAQLDALKAGPLRIVQPDGSEELVSLKATAQAKDVQNTDVVLIVTKSSQTELAAQLATQMLKADGLALTLQNGLGNLEIVADVVGEPRAALGVTQMGAALDGPGVLKDGGPGLTYLATRPQIDEQIQTINQVFEKAGLTTEIVRDVLSIVWNKLAINAAINPLTAILKVRTGKLRDSSWALGLAYDAAREVETVARAQGIMLDDVLLDTVIEKTAYNRSSMLQDVERGAETEIEVICGAVMRFGQELSIPTPVNRLFYRLIKALEDNHANS